ncbi:6932_t:CDS:1, partial [Funneliformis caledonium]
MDIPSNESEYNQKDLNKKNTSVLTSKSVISKRKCQKVLQEFEISKNLKEQANELK